MGITQGVFSIAEDNPPVAGCTVSSLMHDGGGHSVSHFSLAARTSISPERYRYPKLLVGAGGVLQVTELDGAGAGGAGAGGVGMGGVGRPQSVATVQPAEAFVTPVNVDVGSATEQGCVYTELTMREDTEMNDAIKPGEVFALKDLVPYQEGKIVNMDLASDDTMKYVIMAFDAGTGLPEHAAPGTALITALDGEGIIGYEGQEYPIVAGQNFMFAQGGAHYVKADKRFKMSLMLLFK